MKVLDPGHDYELQSLDGDDTPIRLTFVKRCIPSNKYPGNTNSYPGTIIQEVCRALINRLEYVNEQAPDWRNGMAIHAMRETIYNLEERAVEKHAKDWSRKDLEDFEENVIEHYPICKHCGHIACDKVN